MFGLKQVVCPRYGGLCSGANFDCYYYCNKWAKERDRVRAEIRREEIREKDRNHYEFGSKMDRWEPGQPCPWCSACVAEKDMKAHRDYHWHNDSSL